MVGGVYQLERPTYRVNGVDVYVSPGRLLIVDGEGKKVGGFRAVDYLARAGGVEGAKVLRECAVRRPVKAEVIAYIHDTRNFVQRYFRNLERRGLYDEWRYGRIFLARVHYSIYALANINRAIHIPSELGTDAYAFVGPEFYRTPVRRVYEELKSRRLYPLSKVDQMIAEYLVAVGYAGICNDALVWLGERDYMINLS